MNWEEVRRGYREINAPNKKEKRTSKENKDENKKYINRLPTHTKKKRPRPRIQNEFYQRKNNNYHKNKKKQKKNNRKTVKWSHTRIANSAIIA